MTFAGVSGGAANAVEPAASTDAPMNFRRSITFRPTCGLA